MLMTSQSSVTDNIKNTLENKSNNFCQSFTVGFIVGYVFSLSLYCYVVHQSKKKKNNHLNKAKELVKYICFITRRRKQMVVSQMHKLINFRQIRKESKEISVLLERLTSTIWLEELSSATDCFDIDNAIGVGKMGMMYQGNLPNGQLLAVKRLLNSQLFKRQFLSETTILCKYRHKNIVPLLGFCIEGNDRLLAYPYMSNGRLSKWLHPLKSEVVRLKWPQRANIALGIARGSSWLHHICDLHTVHFNICSQSILLDENFEPKISNFGDAKFMNPNNEDDLGKMFKVNDGKTKKDVYDFGSVLFELITGETYDELTRSCTKTNICGNPSNLYNAIDKSLTGEGFENEVCALLKIACECAKPLPDQRPTMLEVYKNISNVKKGRHGSSDDDFDALTGSEIVSSISINEIIEL
ncbi:putative inactive leucine-rich repeat receptor protein kinase [Trifolium repens]|nr:putative inactive leucine-rich repeat receptor protein kinase [Trifolium repens]